ncbi:conserved hypothetical protein [Ricinus communis]|uniref:Uncharacterized protein n=1 Tax=Ricinus communis TaxID=3988 RepID=B9TCI8_RICCO|nr:conserved hypothetical protein [Ricinus communis]
MNPRSIRLARSRVAPAGQVGVDGHPAPLRPYDIGERCRLPRSRAASRHARHQTVPAAAPGGHLEQCNA